MSLSAIGRTGDVTIRMIMNANGKATHTVTSHWYRSSRACGVGSGEWVGCSLYTNCGLYSEHPVNGLHITHHVQGWFPDSESVGSHQVWVLCVPKLSGVYSQFNTPDSVL